MKNLKIQFSFMVLVMAVSLSAHGNGDRGRDFGVFVGGGLTRSMANVAQPGVSAKMKGWGSGVEIGLDLPFSENFGFSPSVEVGEEELLNNFRSDSYLDQTTIKSQAGRGLFYFKGFSVGGSFRKLDIDLKSVSLSSGASVASVDGHGSSAFLGYSFTYRNILRAGVNLEYSQFSKGDFKLTETSVGLRLNLLLSGIFGRD